MEQASALVALRQATSHLHARLEHSLAITRPDAGVRAYVEYLEDMWGWLRPFEATLWQQAWPPEMRAAERAGKLARIEADLRTSGLGTRKLEALPLCGFRPELDSLAARFGTAYVTEGAQLGVRVLAKSLAPRLHGWEPQWLQGYGEHSARNWKMFVECAERHLDTPALRAEAADAAAGAFASLAEWFAERATARRQAHGVQTPATGAESDAVEQTT
jgi:heme oxygenase